VWASVGPTWQKLRDIPTLPTSFPAHWSRQWALYTVFARMSWLRRSTLRGLTDAQGRPSGTWPVSHISVATAEAHYPPPHCAHIHCLASVIVQQASFNITGCSLFFRMEEFSDTPLLRKHFHNRRHFSRLPLCCYLSHGNRTIGGKVQLRLPYQQHPPLTSWTIIIK
jgi:hypothetical protein